MKRRRQAPTDEDRLRLLVSGGGTAGHVYPALAALAAWDTDEASEPDVRWVGTRKGMERDIVTGRDLPYHAVLAGPLRGKSVPTTLAGVLRTVAGIVQSLALLARLRPDVVLTTGGYASVPVAIAAWLLRRPVVVFLPDVRPGLAVRVQARVARRVAAAFEDAVPRLPRRKTVVTGYPVRPALLEADREEARKRLAVEGELPVLLLYGGSLGARTLNYGVAAVLPELLERCRFLHVCGQLDYDELARRTAELPPRLAERYQLHAFLGDALVDALAAADLCVARAGASTLAELPVAGLPAIVVPGPFSDQQANAEFLESHGAAVTLSNEAAQAGALGGLVLQLLDDADARARMREASRELARPDAADRLNAEVRAAARR